MPVLCIIECPKLTKLKLHKGYYGSINGALEKKRIHSEKSLISDKDYGCHTIRHTF